MGLAGAERQELEALINALAGNPAIAIGLARRMVPGQGNIEEFAYGLISGMVFGNFLSWFEKRNSRHPDRDESADIMSVMMARMPLLRKAIMKQLELR